MVEHRCKCGDMCSRGSLLLGGIVVVEASGDPDLSDGGVTEERVVCCEAFRCGQVIGGSMET